MSFPKKNWFGIKEGWKDLGKVRGIGKLVDGELITTTPIHSFCHTIIHIGKEGNEIFEFCPRCFVKFESESISNKE